MGISAYIGILRSDKTLEFINCKYDGFPSRGAGENLIKYFDSYEDAENLISEGNRDCLFAHKGKEIRFYNKSTLKFDDWESFNKFIKNSGETYAYIWNEPVNRWEFVNNKECGIYDLKILSKYLGFK